MANKRAGRPVNWIKGYLKRALDNKEIPACDRIKAIQILAALDKIDIGNEVVNDKNANSVQDTPLPLNDLLK